jgi:hypothetical protein
MCNTLTPFVVPRYSNKHRMLNDVTDASAMDLSHRVHMITKHMPAVVDKVVHMPNILDGAVLHIFL